jgi:hypothetical protein
VEVLVGKTYLCAIGGKDQAISKPVAITPAMSDDDLSTLGLLSALIQGERLQRAYKKFEKNNCNIKSVADFQQIRGIC